MLAVLLAPSGCISFAGVTGGDGGVDAQVYVDANDATVRGDGRTDARVYVDASDATPPMMDCGALPAASSFTDNFGMSHITTNWTRVGCMSAPPIIDGSVVVRTTGALSVCGLRTTDHYRLTCSSVTVKVPQALVQAQGLQTAIYFTNDAGAKVNYMILEDGYFNLDDGTSDKQSGSLYDPTHDIWWKLQESGGTLYFYTSQDGTSWGDPIIDMKLTVPLDNIAIEIGVASYPTDAAAAVPDAGEAQFRCYNLGPDSCQ